MPELNRMIFDGVTKTESPHSSLNNTMFWYSRTLKFFKLKPNNRLVFRKLNNEFY